MHKAPHAHTHSEPRYHDVHRSTHAAHSDPRAKPRATARSAVTNTRRPPRRANERRCAARGPCRTPCATCTGARASNKLVSLQRAPVVRRVQLSVRRDALGNDELHVARVPHEAAVRAEPIRCLVHKLSQPAVHLLARLSAPWVAVTPQALLEPTRPLPVSGVRGENRDVHAAEGHTLAFSKFTQRKESALLWSTN
jgi:hypothetical protein